MLLEALLTAPTIPYEVQRQLWRQRPGGLPGGQLEEMESKQTLPGSVE